MEVERLRLERPPGPKLTTRALRRWLPPLVRHGPDLLTAYLLPGRVPPRVREAAMLGVTSVNRCAACAAVHQRWGARTGLRMGDLSPAEASAYAFGQRLAMSGPSDARPPATVSRRHRRELLAAAILMQLANLAGNRFLPARERTPRLQVGDMRTARLLDLGMRAADLAGLRRARSRVAGRARGDVLEIGIGTGSNFDAYRTQASIHGIDVSPAALSVAAGKASRGGRAVTLVEGDAAALPFADGSFDTVVATFVLCSVGDAHAALREARRVLRPGGEIRLLEHARAHRPAIAALQRRSAPAWARASGGCRLDQDVVGIVRESGLTVVAETHRAGGLLVEIVAAA
jgi:AhpD family alkylhydroperoxidase